MPTKHGTIILIRDVDRVILVNSTTLQLSEALWQHTVPHFKMGDQVLVAYTDVGDKHIARSFVKKERL